MNMDFSNGSGSDGEEMAPPMKHTTKNGAQLRTGKGRKLLLPPSIEKKGKAQRGQHRTSYASKIKSTTTKPF